MQLKHAIAVNVVGDEDLCEREKRWGEGRGGTEGEGGDWGSGGEGGREVLELFLMPSHLVECTRFQSHQRQSTHLHEAIEQLILRVLEEGYAPRQNFMNGHHAHLIELHCIQLRLRDRGWT